MKNSKPSDEQIGLGKKHQAARLRRRSKTGKITEAELASRLSTYWRPPYQGVPFDEIPTKDLLWIFENKFASPNTPDYKYVKFLLEERGAI